MAAAIFPAKERPEQERFLPNFRTVFSCVLSCFSAEKPTVYRSVGRLMRPSPEPFLARFHISIASPFPSPSLNLPLPSDLNPLSRSPSHSPFLSLDLLLPRSPSLSISLSRSQPSLSISLSISIPISISLSFSVIGVEPLAQVVNAPAAADQGQAATPAVVAVVIALGLVLICLQLLGRRIVAVEFCNGINDLNNVIFPEELGSQIRSRGSPGMSSGRRLGSSSQLGA
ncbi:uncharacterized protein LOC131256464 [Magnolia sinica]|uniref:uncharacterized protein LOC131256464 n=1 Tax=Magnolia sinica TaxID=86752 RepID=UPI00265B059D|nr:uncharacterized protein LOC131256464 [Magnolia sinica]